MKEVMEYPVTSLSVLKRAKYRHLGLVWRRHTKFQIGVAAALPAIPLPAPLEVIAQETGQ